MPTRRIDFPTALSHMQCVHPDHAPPPFGLEPGLYEHECPECGKKQTFYVGRPASHTWPRG